MTSETPIDEATGGEVSPEIVDSSRDAAVKSLLALPHKVEEGVLEIQGKTRRYKFTKPLVKTGDPRGDAMIQFEGVLEIEGKPPMPYSMVRLSRNDGLTESFANMNGAKVHVVREPPPQSVVYEGTVEVQVPAPFSYRTTQTISRGEPALERDELEGILTAAHDAVATEGSSRPLLDLVRDSKARRLRRLQARSRVAAE